MKTKSFQDRVFCIQFSRLQILKFVTAVALLLMTSCTKLDTQIYDQVEPANFWNTSDQIAAGVAPAYAGLRDYWRPYNLLELSTDEIIVPTRGGDWFDNGIWRDMWMHTWSPSHPFMDDTWQFIYAGVGQVNQILEAVEGLDTHPKDIESIRAELKTVRAFYHFLALDLFGNVPISESNATDKVTNQPRAEVFAFVEKQLKENLPNLSAEVSPLTYGRATQWFSHAILAKMYLNAEVYTGTTRWQDCIAECDAILNANNYGLEANFFDNFIIENEGSRESIFSLPYDVQRGCEGLYIQLITLHYNSGPTFGLTQGGGVNGFCTAKPFYDIFDPNDARRKMFLVGQQYVNQIEDSLHLQYDTEVNLPLIFDPEITTFSSPEAKFRMAGARCAKWKFNKDTWGTMSNDFALFRLADIIMMKAEAQYRNGDIGGALTTINQQINGVSIRSRAGMPDFTPLEMNPDGLLAERAREFAWEGWRRNDMIRLGHFTDARTPEKAVSEAFRDLYPIPESQLNKNPLLVQNPGY